MNSSWREIKREFQQRRENAELARDDKKHKVYALIPEIQQIDQQITGLGIAFSRWMIKQQQNPGKTAEFEEKLNALMNRKRDLLKEYGFSENYLDIDYFCTGCNDTGFLPDDEGKPGIVPCHCYRQLLVERFYDLSNLNSDGQTGFEFFNENYYPDATDSQGEGLSPRQQALLVRNKCLDFVNRFEETDCANVCFCGPTGVGKTFLSKCIALEILKKGFTVLYMPAPAMFEIIYRSKYSADDTNDTANAYLSILNVDLLIIDDLGTESPSAAKYTELLTLLNYRSARNNQRPCKTILSTNIEPQDLHKIYSERVESRILGEYDILSLSGEDIRLMKRLKRVQD